MTGRLQPGTRLTFRGLADRFGVSEIPAREAVKQLEAEGLMQIVPHTGVMVSRLSSMEVREITEIREALEPLAARLAAERMPDAALGHLDDILVAMEEAVRRRDGAAYSELNREFHRIIYEGSGNRRLYELIFNVWDNVDRYRTVFREVSGHMERSLAEHRVIVAALRARDPEAAYHAMVVHRRNARGGLDRLERMLAAQAVDGRGR